MLVDRAAMHRRAQRAEGDLLRLRTENDDHRRRYHYWFERWLVLDKTKALKPEDLRRDYWIIPKPKGLWIAAGIVLCAWLSATIAFAIAS